MVVVISTMKKINDSPPTSELTKQQVSSSISDLEKSITKLSSDLQAMQVELVFHR